MNASTNSVSLMENVKDVLNGAINVMTQKLVPNVLIRNSFKKMEHVLNVLEVVTFVKTLLVAQHADRD